jgi:hypothetical protein
MMRRNDIHEAKKKLPLPVLMHRLGLGEHGKKSARCPFHEDKHNSFSVWQNDRGWFFKCHAGCGEGDEINLLELRKGISLGDATKLYLKMAGGNGCTPHTLRPNDKRTRGAFNWLTCVEAFGEKHLQRLAHWRGLSSAFCSWLHQRGLIGLYDGSIAFPIQDSGSVVAAHCRLKDGSWYVHPKGVVAMRPLVIGDIGNARVIHAFESQWDAFAVCDKLSLHEKEDVALIITRGASNGALISGLIPPTATVFAWRQNDELKNGKRAGDEWLRAVIAHAGANVEAVTTPEQFKDVNEWTQAGATLDELDGALDRAEVVNATVEARTLASLLDSICAFLQRYIVFQHPEQPIAIALWVLHAWVLDAFEYTAYLHVASPEKQCGKTRLLDCLELLTPRVWRAILPTESVLFRSIEQDNPTLLLDELDAVFSNSKDENKEALRALLNSGFEKKATVPRCFGPNHEVRPYRVFCAKALAGIGRLPDTVRDRCVPIQLARRSRDEPVERFRKREAEKEVSEIRSGLEAWSQQSSDIETLRASRPHLPDALSDRQADICEPLLAIAELAGGDWPERGKNALVKLCSQNDEDESIGAKLLSDIRSIFDDTKADRLSTKDMLEALVALETDAPWAEWWEFDLKNQNIKSCGAKLARKLKQYGIKPSVFRASGELARGYARKDFEQSWNRYCPRFESENVTM